MTEPAKLCGIDNAAAPNIKRRKGEAHAELPVWSRQVSSTGVGTAADPQTGVDECGAAPPISQALSTQVSAANANVAARD